MEEFVYKERYSHPTSACLNLTDDCNFMCRYCFVAQHPHYMSLDVAKQGVEWLIKNKKWKQNHNLWDKNEKIGLTYFGGEPTLLWDQIIVPLTEWINDTYPEEFTFNMTTNGSLLNEERILFMFKHNIKPHLSVDGAYETQEYNRPCKNKNLNSADLVYKNIPTILHYFPYTCFRSTIDEHTVSHTFENYIFAQCLGFKNIYMMPNCRDKWSENNLNILKEEFSKIYLYYIKCFENNIFPINFTVINDSFESIKKHNIAILTNNLNNNNFYRLTRCGLGTSGCSIGYDGKIYGCQEQDSKGIESRFFLGDIFTGIDESIHMNFLKEYFYSTPKCGDKINYCDDCPLINVCGDKHCPSSCYDVFKDFGKESYVHCYWQRFLYEQAIIVLKYLENNNKFKEYLVKSCSYDFLEEGD